MRNKQLGWLSERMEDVPGYSRFYKIICFLCFRRKKKFTYRDWYIILSILNGQTREGNQFAMDKVLRIYKLNNNELPQELNEV